MTYALSVTRHSLSRRAGLALLATALALPLPALATTAAERGLEIAERSDVSDNGFGDSTVELEMILRNAAGQETSRKLTIATLERESGDVGDKSMVVFSEPRDIRSTALLTHAKILEADDQWLYLPALKRVKRISSGNKSGPFVGSELAFEDFSGQELGKFTYEFIGEETVDGMAMDVVDRFPTYEGSGYTRQRAYFDQDVYQLRQVDFYDRKGAFLKTLRFLDFKLYAGQYWRPLRLDMQNHQTGKSTQLVYSDYVFSAGLSDSDFQQGKLKSVR